eukprot:TRINITY_DN58449_c0_g1_i1.p1 TRINITY_DN58449_c0_g1~~TRINITY_DN58449_c0_g1_i1.p1  ORF type:complete len:366 (+),score=100.64 TRINITY_DN58449_c0_g1_i1:66-1163(+)
MAPSLLRLVCTLTCLAALTVLVSHYVFDDIDEGPEDAVLQKAEYNRAVLRWKGKGEPFRRNRFEAFATDSLHRGPLRHIPLARATDEEGSPPQYGFEGYSATRYESRAQIFESLPFDTRLYFILLIRGVGEAARITPDDVVFVPGFFWTWDGSAKHQTSCEGQFGAWVNNACLKIYMLDRVCVTVAQRADGLWRVQRTYGRSGVGCTPPLYPTDTPSSEMLGEWSAGSYTQVNSTEVLGVDFDPTMYSSNGPNNGSQPLRPFQLLPSRWVGDFASVHITTRSNYDPRLTAEYLTNGTLEFIGQPEPTEMTTLFSLLWRFLLWCVVIIFIVMAFAWLSPTCRNMFPVMSATPRRRNKLQAASLLYA